MEWTEKELEAIADLKAYADDYEAYLRGNNKTITHHMKRMKVAGSVKKIDEIIAIREAKK